MEPGTSVYCLPQRRKSVLLNHFTTKTFSSTMTREFVMKNDTYTKCIEIRYKTTYVGLFSLGWFRYKWRIVNCKQTADISETFYLPAIIK